MDIIQWLPTILFIVFPIALFVGRNWLRTKIVAGTEHKFNLKLEELRSELRSKESEIATLREAVITS